MNLIARPRRVAAPPPTLIDRVVSYFAPAAGVERMKARTMLAAASGEGGYKGGRRDRRPTRNWRPPESSADADILPDLPDLRGRARDLARNTPIATGAIATNVTNVVGEGLQLQAQIDAEVLGLTADQADAMEREQEREFALFAADCDFTRVQDLHEQSALALRSALESGDAFVVRRFRKDPGDVYGTKLQIIEADRVSNPDRAADTDRIAGGIECDDDGVPIAVHVTDRHPGGMRVGALKWTRVPTRTKAGLAAVIHLYDRMRPEQTRGVPYLAPVVEHLKQLGDYADAEVTAAVISAMFTLAIETPEAESDQPIIGEKDSALEANEVKLGNGAVISLAPGEKPHSINPGRPNAQFDPFTQAFLRQIGVALELPFELLIKHFTASYSASRAALEMAWQFFRRRRAWLARRLHQVVYGWMMDEAVASGRLVRPGYFADPVIRQAWLGAVWIGPNRASIDPKKEAEADEIDIRLGTKTREQVCLERTGGQFEDKHRQAAKEAAMRRADGLDTPPPAATAQSSGAGEDAAEDDGDDADTDTDDDAQQARARA